jgi:hypothetical protein
VGSLKDLPLAGAITVKAALRPSAPMKRPVSNTTLSRGESWALLRLMVRSSALKTSSAKSNIRAKLSRLARLSSPSWKTFSSQTSARIPAPISSLIRRASGSASVELPMKRLGGSLSMRRPLCSGGKPSPPPEAF